jgi:hypothetical protein
VRTYLVTVRVDAPDDRIGLRVAQDVADHIRDHYRHDTARITAGAPQRVPGDLPRSKYQMGPMEKRWA